MKLEAKNLLDALSEKGINYKLFEHEAFFTVEESSKLKNDLDMQGAHTKNLFLRDKKRNFFLLSCLDNQEVDLKEIKLRPNIDEHDYQVKMRNVQKFLDEGDKVKVTMRFRGREMAHQELGVNVLNRVRDDTEDVAKIEAFPKLEGRQMIMVIAPK